MALCPITAPGNAGRGTVFGFLIRKKLAPFWNQNSASGACIRGLLRLATTILAPDVILPC